jgi:type II secretion system protein I
MTAMWNRVASGWNRKSLSQGLTLLEVLIALVIISTALVGLVRLENEDIRAITRAQRMTLAAMLARNMLAQIELAGFPEDLGEEEGDFQEEEEEDEGLKVPYAGFRWKKAIEPLRFGGMTFEDARRVQVTIFWNEGTLERHLDVVTYLTKREEEPEI